LHKVWFRSRKLKRIASDYSRLEFEFRARHDGAAETRIRSQRSTGGSPGQTTPSQELQDGCQEEEEGEEEEVVFSQEKGAPA
jgi:hypothetical protein